MGAEYLFCMKSIETNARAFLALTILGIGTVTVKYFHCSFQYALLSTAVMLVVFAIKEGHWDSTEEMNEVRNVAKMHTCFTMLFFNLVLIWKVMISYI